MRRNSGESFVLLASACLVMLACGVIPLGFVFFYSVHDTFAGNDFLFVGGQWFWQVFNAPEFQWALLRSLLFSVLVLLVQIPLGLWVALRLPKSGILASVLVVAMAVPLLTPALVVGYLWKVLALPEAGLLTNAAAIIGLGLDMNSKLVTWTVLLLMDAWHWTSLVVLLAYAGLKAIPANRAGVCVHSYQIAQSIDLIDAITRKHRGTPGIRRASWPRWSRISRSWMRRWPALTP